MKFYKTLIRWMRFALIFFFTTSILSVVILKWMPVYFTPLMGIRAFQQWQEGREVKCEHEWTPLSSISKSMPKAVIASEDAHFLSHNGFETEQIKQEIIKAQKRAEQNDGEFKFSRGYSTISQQTAKNVFLWQGEGWTKWLRKGFEVYFTFLIEHIWGKERIMEVYLNSIEMGDGIYGAQAVAKHNFHKRASLLSDGDAAMIAGTLPNPLKRDSAHPTARMIKRQHRILREMRAVPRLDWDAYQ